jgi:hypothetical protein
MEAFSSIGAARDEHNHSLQFGSTTDKIIRSDTMYRVEMFSLPKITTLLAPVRLSPVPPASVEIKNMNTSGELLNLSIMGMPKHYEKK